MIEIYNTDAIKAFAMILKIYGGKSPTVVDLLMDLRQEEESSINGFDEESGTLYNDNGGLAAAGVWTLDDGYKLIVVDDDRFFLLDESGRVTEIV